jgi:hypothetical protein
MNNYVICLNDQAVFNPAFPPNGTGAMVTVPPFLMLATDDLKAQNIPVCLDGDQNLVIIPGCPYIRGVYFVPGTGIVTIKNLGVDQLSINTTYKGRRVILLGSVFEAKFTVVSPAWKPGETWIPDSTPSYDGNGFFTTTNYKVKVS